MDPIELFDRASAWTSEKIRGAGDLSAKTACDEWDARTVVNHLIDGARFFERSAKGEQADMPSPTPPDLAGDDPVASYDRARQATLAAFREPGALEKAGPLVGIAFADHLIHGWDLATGTGQDTTMPDGLAEAAFEMLNGRLTEENRKGMFAPEVPAPEGADVQQRLLAYVGRSV